MSESRNDIYVDTVDIADAMVEDYDFYTTLLKLMSKGNSVAALNTKSLKKKIDEGWVSVIEQSLPALDIVIRKHGRDIIEKEEVLPIELSKNITARSIRHLGQHSNFIKDIDESGNVTPSKILNVYKEENILTYENKFVNTLLNRLLLFINKRYEKLLLYANDESLNEIDLQVQMQTQGTDVKMSLKIETKTAADISASHHKTNDEVWKRVEHIRNVILKYEASPFITEMGRNFVRPPIMRTNAILKNQYLHQCLNLWQFIESYDEVGFTIEESQTHSNPSNALTKQLFALLAFQYVVFRYNTEGELEDDMGRKTKKKWRTINPKILRKSQEFVLDDYNFYEVEDRRILTPAYAKNKRLTDSEIEIKNAIDYALKEEYHARKSIHKI